MENIKRKTITRGLRQLFYADYLCKFWCWFTSHLYRNSYINNERSRVASFYIHMKVKSLFTESHTIPLFCLCYYLSVFKSEKKYMWKLQTFSTPQRKGGYQEPTKTNWPAAWSFLHLLCLPLYLTHECLCCLPAVPYLQEWTEGRNHHSGLSSENSKKQLLKLLEQFGSHMAQQITCLNMLDEQLRVNICNFKNSF